MTYSILAGISTACGKWEIIFGDPDHEVVQQERRDLQDSGDRSDYSQMRVDRLPNDRQATINNKLRLLNEATQLTYAQQIQRAAFLCGEEYANYGFEDAEALANKLAKEIGAQNDVAKKLVMIDLHEEIEFQF
jgi:ATP-dependent exoDNAse (exonuclease V) alpha subunit